MKLFLSTLVISLMLTACSTKVSDKIPRFLSALSLKELTILTLESNSTNENQKPCAEQSRLVIQRSFPKDRKAFCRDRSHLNPELSEGLNCPGGVKITRPNTNPNIVDCNALTACGMPPTSATVIGQRADGGVIEQLVFTELPWGCNAQVEFSYDEGFPAGATGVLKTFVQPPDCPFCNRTNQRTCLPCDELKDDEKVKAGQVVVTSCKNRDCKPCEVLNKAGEFIEHGQSKVFYDTILSACGKKCSARSEVRVCNDGLWQGKPEYQYPQCNDAPCGCAFPGETVTYSHNTSKVIYQMAEPACGVECSTVAMTVTCNDGVWESGDPRKPTLEADLKKYPARSCAKKICHCERPGREIVADGQSRDVYSKNPAGCSERCTDLKGVVTCKAGKLTATDDRFINFGFDSCAQQDCGCKIELPGTGNTIFLANGGTTKLFQYTENSVTVPDACTNPNFQLDVKCQDKVLVPKPDTTKFQYRTCTTKPLGCTFTDAAGSKTSIAHLGSLVVTKNLKPDCGEACFNMRIYCEDRVLKKQIGGAAISATELAEYKSAGVCSPKNCDCNVNGQIISYNATATFFKIESGTDCNPQACELNKTSITCTKDGPVSSKGDKPLDYKFRSCTVIPCGCPLPWGGTIDSGRTFPVFAMEKATCEDKNACTKPTNMKEVSCVNGKLTEFDTTVFKYPTCAPPLCECGWGKLRVPIGQTINVFKKEKPEAGESCGSLSTKVKCETSGVFSGANELEYPYTECLDPTDDGSGGGSGGGTGNDEGPGAGIKKRIGLGDGGGGGGGGGPCLTFDCAYVATNVWHMPNYKIACVLPWGGGEIEHYGSVAAFRKKCVVPPEKCSSHRTIRTCHETLTGGKEYIYATCEEKASCP